MAASESLWNVHHTGTTPFCADSVERCPHIEGLMAVGTYQLDEETRKRHGGFQVASVATANNGLTVTVGEATATDGVLDAKWCPQQLHTTPILASATAGGCVELLALNADSNKLDPLVASDPLVPDDGSMALSLDWAGRTSSGAASEGTLAVSSTHSTLHILQATPTGLTETQSWRAHEFFGGADIQVWITTFCISSPTVLLSGGDDSKLKMWDTRSTAAATWTSTAHEQGVCSAQWSSLASHLFATGSYDGTVAVWDARQLKTPALQLEQGGGVWRVKWHPTRPGVLATAAMRGGFHTIDTAQAAGGEGDAVYMGHLEGCEAEGKEHLAYGVDWAVVPDTDQWVLGSASFYDASFHVWSPKTPAQEAVVEDKAGEAKGQ